MRRYNLRITDSSVINWNEVESCQVDSYVWGGGERAYGMYAKVVYAASKDENEGLYFRLFCEEKEPVSRETTLDGEVCMDSCMEFFFTMRSADGKENGYLNVETNSIGTTHIGYGAGRYGRVFLPELGVERFPVKVCLEDEGWSVTGFVCIEALKKIFGISKFDETTVMRGNFYKCDENAGAPFGTWSPIDIPKPDFHRPEYFGEFVIGE